MLTRTRRGRALALPVALVLTFASLLTGCGPAYTADTMACLANPPRSIGDYWTVFASRSVWSGGDIGAPLTLPDGRVLWFWGDTFVDGLNAAGYPHHGMVRNSIVEQNGRCFRMITWGGYGLREGPLKAANAAGGEWLWPSAAVIDSSGYVRVTALRMAEAPGPTGWNWVIRGVDVVTLSQSLIYLTTVHAPVTQDGVVNWGGGAVKQGAYTYIYGWRKDHQVVARVPTDEIGSTPWEFFTPGGWTRDREAARQPTIQNAPAAMFWVVPHKGGFLASSKRAEMNSDDVSTWYSTSPVGPWTFVGRAALTYGQGTPYITYAGRVTSLPGVGMTAMWSQNDRTGNPNFNFNNFGPVFTTPMTGSVP